MSQADDVIAQVKELKRLAIKAKELNRLSFEENGWFWPLPIPFGI